MARIINHSIPRLLSALWLMTDSVNIAHLRIQLQCYNYQFALPTFFCELYIDTNRFTIKITARNLQAIRRPIRCSSFICLEVIAPFFDFLFPFSSSFLLFFFSFALLLFFINYIFSFYKPGVKLKGLDNL